MTEVNNTAEDDKPSFTNSRGQNIVCRYWDTAADSTLSGLVLVIHGFGEHCGWYDEIATRLAKQGFFVASHDHVGHGLSEGKRTMVSDFQEYVDDLFQHVDIITKKHPSLPLFLLGHSMGGCISILALQQKPDLFAGAVLIGPLVVPSPESAITWKVMAAKLLAWLSPEIGVAKLNPGFISKDTTIVDKYEADPLVFHGKLKAGWGVACLRSLTELQSKLNDVSCPLLVIHGDDDKLCELSGARMLHTLAASKDKTLSVYPGAYHQVHNEPDGVGEKCKQEILDWFVARTATS